MSAITAEASQNRIATGLSDLACARHVRLRRAVTCVAEVLAALGVSLPRAVAKAVERRPGLAAVRAGPGPRRHFRCARAARWERCGHRSPRRGPRELCRGRG